jgi:hypothetical protein
MTVRKKTQKTARKIPDKVRLLEMGKNLASNDAENLAEALEKFGAKASTYLLSDDERWERWIPMGRHDVCIPFLIADSIAAILFSLPRGGKPGPREKWSSDIRSMAFAGLLAKKPIRALAREISAVTGQPVDSTRRRLQEMNAGDSSLKILRAAERKSEERADTLRKVTVKRQKMRRAIGARLSPAQNSCRFAPGAKWSSFRAPGAKYLLMSALPRQIFWR